MINLYSMIMSPLLRAFFILLGTTTGVWVRFENIRGDFFSYKASLDGFEIEIANGLTCSAKTCSLEFSLLDFSLDTLIVSNVFLDGARVEYNRSLRKDLLPSYLPPFLIRNLVIKNGVVNFRDQSRGIPFSMSFFLDDYHCESLHSRWIIFDSIFTSQIKGRMNESAFFTHYSEKGQICQSRWIIDGLPMRMVSPFAKGRLDLIEQSAMNLSIHSEWMLEEDEIIMKVQVLILDLINIDLPKIVPTSTQRLADILSVLVNHQVKDIPMAFKFKINKDNFMNLTEMDAIGIISAFNEGLLQAIMDKNLQNYDHVRSMGLLGLDALRDIKNIFDKYK